MAKKLKRLWKESKHIKELILLIILFTSIGFFNVFLAKFLGLITENMVSNNLEKVKQAIIYFTVIGIIIIFLTYLTNVFQTRVIESMRVQFKEKTLVGLLNSSQEFTDKQEKGDIINRLNSDISSIVSASNSSILLIKSLLLLSMLSLSLYLIDWRLFIILVIPLPFIIFIQLYVSKKSVDFIMPWKVAMGETDALNQDLLHNRTSIRVLRIYDRVESWVDKALTKSAKNGINGISKLYIIQTPTTILAILPMFFMGGFGAYWIQRGMMTITQLVSAFTIIQLVMLEFNYATNALQNIPHLLVSTERIFPIWDAPVEVFGDYQGEGLEYCPIIEFRNVFFSYPNAQGDEEIILNNVSFKINEYDKVGFVGTSGSGKSTIFKLLTGMYLPTQGTIYIKGIELQKWNKETLRNLLTMITQNTYLFNDTIYNNLRYVKKDVNEQTLYHLLEQVNLERLVSTENKDHLIGELGSKLSGGQRQRLMIARALLRDSDIYLMDEATSALDVKTEKFIQASINQKMMHKTQLLIAHRFSTLKDCTNIFVLDKGSIVEQGTHDELLNKDSIYAMLYYKQEKEGNDEKE